MIRRLLRRRGPKLPPGERVYAIGDVHGRFDLLTDLILKIADENAALKSMRTYIVFVGDLIDRGPASKHVLTIAQQATRHGAQVVVLKGNHEEMLIDAWRGDLDALEGWLAFGGVETLVSFGVVRDAIDPNWLDGMLALLRATVSEATIAWLDALPTLWQLGDYAFVHAGIRPGLPLDRQEAADLLWIRDDFLYFEGRHERIVVHGHTIVDQVEFHPNRIAIDTGAYQSGRLSALCLQGREQRVISVARETVRQEAAS